MTDRWDTQVGQLRLIGGVRQEHPRNLSISERRGLLPIKSRGRGKLYVLVELSGEKFGREEMCQDLANAIAEEYFGTPGTVTYGLRQAVLLANTQLVRANARVTSEHRMGGVACVVLRDGEAFIAQAGWPMVYLVHQERVEAYPDTTLEIEDTSMLGQRQTADVRLFHAHVQPGDMVLMADGPMARQLGVTRIGQILSSSVSRAMSNLETLAPPEDCTAIVIQIGSAEARPRAQKEQWAFTPVEQPTSADTQPRPEPRRAPSPASSASGAAQPARPAARELDQADRPPARQPVPPQTYSAPELQVRQPAPPSTYAAPEPPPSPRSTRARAGRSLGKQAGAVFSTIAQGVRTLGERMLPDRAPRSTSARRRRAARQRRTRGQAVGQPNLGLAAALAIPIVALIVVGATLTYRNWAAQSQFETKLDEARREREYAIGNAEVPATARDHWLEVIALATAAGQLQPESDEVQQLLNQAAVEIDRIDGITRLGQAVKLYDYVTPSIRPRRVVVAGLDVYVLDRDVSRVYHHTLNEQRNALQNPDKDQVLIQPAQTIDDQTLAELVDIAWMRDGGERQAGALLIVDRKGLMIEYDPSWEQLHIESLGNVMVWRGPVALKTFDANLYILDPHKEANQIFKYPEGQYASAPASWIQSEIDISGAVDIGIDGSIYMLHSNGRIDQLFAGETVPFDVTGMPKPLVHADAFYMDIPEVAQYLYIADTSEMRIVQLDREGAFVRQLRPPAAIEMAFRQLSGLFVDETGGKIYYTTANALYVADLPPVQR
jgi:hypothetical protein